MQADHDVAVVGAGPIGAAAALAAARAGFRTALVAPPARFEPGRTAAVMEPSLAWLATLGVSEALEAAGAPLAGISIVDVTGSLFRAPSVDFRARDIGLERFGLNIANDALVSALEAALAREPLVTRFALTATGVETANGAARLRLADRSTLAARAVIAADGKRSALRESAGIGVTAWRHRQTALTFHVLHRRDHFDVSTELHTRSGPFTLVPMGLGRSSVVWMMEPRRAKRLLALDDAAFSEAATQESEMALGRLTLVGDRGRIPMEGLVARRFASGPLALVGEAAHAFPPIGAQGLNLGLRDAKSALSALAARPDDPSAAFAAYDRERRLDVGGRTLAVEALNRSLLMDLPPLDLARGAVMTALAAAPPLRRLVMRVGVGARDVLGFGGGPLR
jgi:2-octaprenyl-6-methoxyphenol hydroxylase